jgi:hypothetical protein
MRQHPARAMYDQIEGTLTSITMQLRSAIRADAETASRSGAMAGAAVDSLRRPSNDTCSSAASAPALIASCR